MESMIGYERGLERFMELARNTDWFEEATIFEARLLDNLDEERLYGKTEQVRSDRSRITRQLNRLAREHLTVTFIDLCKNRRSNNQDNYTETTDQPNVLEESEKLEGFGSLKELDRHFDEDSTPRHVAEYTSPSSPLDIFVGYSSRDTQYAEELRTHLASEIRAGKAKCWDDTEIQPGTVWRQEMRKDLQAANKAILLVSAHFLASDFILHEELPQLLTLAKDKKLIIMSVIVRPCRFNTTELAQFRTINSPLAPLSAMSKSKRDEVWVKVVEHINLV